MPMDVHADAAPDVVCWNDIVPQISSTSLLCIQRLSRWLTSTLICGTSFKYIARCVRWMKDDIKRPSPIVIVVEWHNLQIQPHVISCRRIGQRGLVSSYRLSYALRRHCRQCINELSGWLAKRKSCESPETKTTRVKPNGKKAKPENI